MRNTLGRVLFCGGLLALSTGFVGADPGDVYQAGGNFSSGTKMKASDTPLLRAVMSIPADIGEGDEFTINCRVDTAKTASGKPMKGVKGTAATFANKLDVGSGSWQFFGLVGSGIPFSTGKDGSVVFSTGPVTAGSWASVVGTNDNLSISVTFTNAKRVVSTSLGCELIVA